MRADRKTVTVEPRDQVESRHSRVHELAGVLEVQAPPTRDEPEADGGVCQDYHEGEDRQPDDRTAVPDEASPNHLTLRSGPDGELALSDALSGFDLDGLHRHDVGLLPAWPLMRAGSVGRGLRR